jgi:uncharacterized UBP type Zn finger protein
MLASAPSPFSNRRYEHDVHDFMAFLRNEIDETQKFINQVQPQQQDLQHTCFKGGWSKHRTCTSCHLTLSPIEEIFEDISLPLTRFRHTVQFDLQTMCNEYLADEIVQMQCRNCSMSTTNVDFNVKTAISRCPQVLTIQLKRFSFTFGAVRGQKLMDSVFCSNELKLPINGNTAIATYTITYTLTFYRYL